MMKWTSFVLAGLAMVTAGSLAQAANPQEFHGLLQEARNHAQQLCQIAAPYQSAPGWSTLHQHAVEVSKLTTQAEVGLSRQDAGAVRQVARHLEELGECIEDVAEDLDDWRCPLTAGNIYDAHVAAAVNTAECLEEITERLEDVSDDLRFGHRHVVPGPVIQPVAPQPVNPYLQQGPRGRQSGWQQPFNQSRSFNQQGFGQRGPQPQHQQFVPQQRFDMRGRDRADRGRFQNQGRGFARQSYVPQGQLRRDAMANHPPQRERDERPRNFIQLPYGFSFSW
ncbi:hypothetical protein [Calycomorphotria hydatis]|nr:hypothetical protein [Calycomorphotria hydatis]